jgi:hypothetical protein
MVIKNSSGDLTIPKANTEEKFDESFTELLINEDGISKTKRRYRMRDRKEAIPIKRNNFLSNFSR